MTQGRAATHSAKTWRTGSMPMALRASSRVSRMSRKPSPRSELSRDRFRATVSSTLMGSESRDLTRSPSTTSWMCSPSREWMEASAVPKRSA